MKVKDAACVIVAGGKASRLGHRVKALLEVGGHSILDRALEVLEPRFAALAIAANDAAPFQGRGLPIVADEVPGQGPLAGIQSALRWCRRPYVLVVPCDMPFLDGRIIDLLLSRRGPGIDAVVPFVGELPEPLFALYGRPCLPVLERRLKAGQYRASGLALDEALTVARVGESDLRAIDPELTFLTNVNTPADLMRSRERGS